jgi:hypothetical protein
MSASPQSFRAASTESNTCRRSLSERPGLGKSNVAGDSPRLNISQQASTSTAERCSSSAWFEVDPRYTDTFKALTPHRLASTKLHDQHGQIENPIKGTPPDATRNPAMVSICPAREGVILIVVTREPNRRKLW